MNLIIWHLRDGLISSDLEKIDAALHDADGIPHPYLAQFQPKPVVAEPVMPGTVFSFERKRLDEVTPPSWWKSEEDNWAGIEAFMGSRPG